MQIVYAHQPPKSNSTDVTYACRNNTALVTPVQSKQLKLLHPINDYTLRYCAHTPVIMQRCSCPSTDSYKALADKQRAHPPGHTADYIIPRRVYQQLTTLTP
jgi:hypothetical protein